MSPNNVSNVRRIVSPNDALNRNEMDLITPLSKWFRLTTNSQHNRVDNDVSTPLCKRAKRLEFHETNSNEIANPTVVWVKRSRIGVFASSSEVECAIHSPLVWIRLTLCGTFNWRHSIGTIRNRKVRMCMYNSVRVQLCTRQFGSEGIEWSHISELNT